MRDYTGTQWEIKYSEHQELFEPPTEIIDQYVAGLQDSVTMILEHVNLPKTDANLRAVWRNVDHLHNRLARPYVVARLSAERIQELDDAIEAGENYLETE